MIVPCQIVIMSQRTKFNMLEMGGLDELASKIEGSKLDITNDLLLYSISESTKSRTGYVCRMEVDLNVDVSDLDNPQEVERHLKHALVGIDWDMTKIHLGTRYRPKKKTCCPYCGELDCMHPRGDKYDL